MPDGGTIVAPRLAAEHVGRARDLVRKVRGEDQRYVANARRLLEPVRSRLHKHPRRNFRPSMLSDLECRWHVELNAPYRLQCRSELSKDRLTLHEICLSAMTLQNLDWERSHGEPGVAIAHSLLDLHRG